MLTHFYGVEKVRQGVVYGLTNVVSTPIIDVHIVVLCGKIEQAASGI